ncbi:MAG: HAD-IIB family hydrolase [Desulfopila sp.]
MEKILLCSDLDRTILPNGPQPSSADAIALLHRLHQVPGFTLAYVSGRNKNLIAQAIEEYGIPVPDFAIGDVGTTIYEPGRDWRPWKGWSTEIASDWNQKPRVFLEQLLGGIKGLELQEESNQNSLKLSYYTVPERDMTLLLDAIRLRLEGAGIKAAIIHSIDEEENLGLIDILPQHATKVHAIRFLMNKTGIDEDRTVFAGDSGNDLPALTSGLNAVLVKNASKDVREQAMHRLAEKGWTNRLYTARGGFLGMNGNYCAGVLEGLAYFLPETLELLKT